MYSVRVGGRRMGNKPKATILKNRGETYPMTSLPAGLEVQRVEEDEVSACNCVVESPSPEDGINVLVADDTEMGTQLLADALRRSPHFQVIAAQGDAFNFLGQTSNWEPQIALISSTLNRGGLKGLELSRRVRSTFPNVRVVILLERSTRNSVIEAFRAGAQGVFCRTDSPKLLRKCILCVRAGQVWANSAQMHFLLESLYEVRFSRPLVDAKGLKLLSKREEDVLSCAVDGLKNREIAEHLHLSEHTIKNYMFRIFDKLGVSSRVEMILYALSQRSSSFDASSGYELVHDSRVESGPSIT